MTPVIKTTDNLLLCALTALVVLRILMVAGFVADIPPIQHTGWQFHCGGGDQILYFNMAQSFAALSPIKEKYPVGFPLLLTPLVLFYKPAVWQDLVMPVVMFHTMLALISIYLVGYITKALTKSTSLSILSALVWTITPYAIYALAAFFNTQWIRNTYVSYLMWFSMLSEPATTFFLLLSLYCYFLSLEKKHLAWLVGITAGMTMVIRIPGLFYAAVFASGYMLSRRYRELAIFSACVLLMVTPQLIYNSVFYNSPLTFGYTYAPGQPTTHYSFAYTITFVMYLINQHPRIFCFLLMGALTVAAAILYMYKNKSAVHCWVVLTSIVGIHAAFYSAWWGFLSDFIRFLMPVVPIVIIIAAGLIGALQNCSMPVIRGVYQLVHKQ
jgi:phage-related protein